MPVLNEQTGELVIDLSSEFLSIEGPELPKAFAQIVWTVSEIEGVEQVRFLVDGEEIRAQDADGRAGGAAVKQERLQRPRAPAPLSYSKNTCATS